MATTQIQIEVFVGIGSPAQNALVLDSTVPVAGSAGGIRTTTDPADPGSSTEEDVTSLIGKVEVRFGNGAFQQATPTGPSTKKWSSWSFVGPMPSGVSPLTITARATLGLATGQESVSVRLDTTGPTIVISAPDIVTLDGSQVLAPISGSVKDLESGVKQLDWLRNGSATATSISPINNVGNWSTSVPFTQAGKQTIVVRATDNQNNVAAREVLVDVALPFTSVDPDDVLGAGTYLADLLDFAKNRLNPAIGSQLISNTFCQRYDVLPAAGAAAVQPVPQARVCVEVLRSYLKNRLPSPPAAVRGLLSSGEREYARRAYDVLLLQLGTSYDELRQARSADEQTRAALADRLGFAALTPDLLDGITLHPNSITEADLERVFGLADTKSDPFSALPTPEPLVLNRQHTRLSTLWQQQDDPNERPLIDPDVVGEDEVISGIPAATLRADRQAFVQSQLAALRTLRDTALGTKGSTQATAFKAVVEAVLGSGAVIELGRLADDDGAGIDITAGLAAKQLELPAFRYLVRVLKLAAAGAVQENEWADVFSILVQVRKVRLYSTTWRPEERAKTLSVGPDFFKFGEDGVAAPGGALPAWRATRQARREFEDTLRARIDQKQAVRDALAAAIKAAENAALPLLRDRLIDAIARASVPDATKPASPSADVSRLLGQELFVDFAASGADPTSRLDQATETLQRLV